MKDRLATPSYCFILAANFLLYFGFWLLIPVLPFYLSEVFRAGNSTIGIILSCYTIAALCIRPFSGYLLDSFARKPLYLLSYFIFTSIFAGYIVAGSLTLFIIFRIIHGVSFGMVTVGGNTVVIDIMPSSRRGEGLGYYGLTNNTAMSIGPMTGLFMHDAEMSVAAVPYNISIQLGILDLDGRDVKGLIEKPKYNYYANAGIYLIKKRALAEIPEDTFFHATHLVEKLIAQGKKVIRYPLNGTWIDIGTHQEYERAKELVKHLK